MKPTKSDKIFIILLIVMAFIIVFVASYNHLDEAGEVESVIYQERIEQSGGDLTVVENMISDGAVSFYSDTQLAYIDEDRWLLMSRRDRMEITIQLGIYITNERNGSVYWVNVYGMYTRKKLAVWSEPTGYKEYPFYDQQYEKQLKIKYFMLNSPFSKFI